jgi:hypothetical protein
MRRLPRLARLRLAGRERRPLRDEPALPAAAQEGLGNEDQERYVAWLTGFAKLARDALKPTGSLVIDIGGAYQRGAAGTLAAPVPGAAVVR